METTKQYPVLGMSCAACAVSTESMLLSLAGVKNAAVNYANATVNVVFDSDIVQPEAMKAALQSIGYDLVTDETNTEEIVAEADQMRLSKLTRNLQFAVLFTLPVFIIGMFFMEMPYANYIMLTFSVPVIFYSGKHFFVNAYHQAKNRHANMDTLVAMSTGIAFVFSVFNTFFQEYWHNIGLHAHVYYESATVVITFILLGKWLEERAKSNTSEAIKKLMGLQPKTVTVLDNLMEKTIPVHELKKGQQIVVKPGDKIPVDGVVSYGESYVNESLLTGEPVPVLKKSGEKVYSGSINKEGSFVFEAIKVGNETFLANIIKTVQQAQGSKAPVQKLVDKIAGIFVPVVIAIAIITFLAWMALGGSDAIFHALVTSVTVLVIACPCALGLATPTAIMVGVGKGAENQILIKDAESLETAHRVDAIILDKTGTITQGKPLVTDSWFENENKEQNTAKIRALESKSTHPLAEAIVQFLSTSEKQNLEISAVENISGKGIKGKINNTFYYTGSISFLREKGVKVDLPQLSQWEQEAKTVVCFFNEEKLLAAFAISDPIKGTSLEAIKQLKEEGIAVYMLTGDNKYTAKAIAEKAGIEVYKAEVMPSEKAAFVKQLQKEGKTVAMVGDGINDSEALALADISIAMGKGSDIAIDVAKITLITSDLLVIPKAIRLSVQTIKTIKQNLFWAFIYNLIGIPLAAGLLYPINGFLLDPMIAGAAMALSSVSVISNSLRLKFFNL